MVSGHGSEGRQVAENQNITCCIWNDKNVANNKRVAKVNQRLANSPSLRCSRMRQWQKYTVKRSFGWENWESTETILNYSTTDRASNLSAGSRACRVLDDLSTGRAYIYDEQSTYRFLLPAADSNEVSSLEALSCIFPWRYKWSYTIIWFVTSSSAAHCCVRQRADGVTRIPSKPAVTFFQSKTITKIIIIFQDSFVRLVEMRKRYQGSFPVLIGAIVINSTNVISHLRKEKFCFFSFPIMYADVELQSTQLLNWKSFITEIFLHVESAAG